MPLQRALQVSIEMWALKLRISFSRRRNGWKEVKRDEGSRLQLYSLPHWWSQDILKLYLETSSILFSGMMFAKEGTLNSLLKGVNLSSAQNNPTVIAGSCLLTTHCCVQFPNRVSECPIPSPTSATTNPHACLSKICKVTKNCFQIVECECKIKSTLHPQVCLSEVQGQESAKSQTTVYGIILYTTSILYPVTTVKLARVLLHRITVGKQGAGENYCQRHNTPKALSASAQ